MTDAEEVLTLFQKEGSEISELSNTINPDELLDFINLIKNTAGNIFITGCGTSAMAAKKAVHTLNVIDQRAFYLNPSDAVHGSLGAVHENDLVIIISKGGNTAELTNFLPNLLRKHVNIVGITEDRKSQIAKTANLIVHLRVNHELDEFNMLATTSTLAVISVFDVVAVMLMKKKQFSKQEFLINHPSGAVGKRLMEDSNN
jgi:D-arabinose 5-phosphate isomerase GutQ